MNLLCVHPCSGTLCPLSLVLELIAVPHLCAFVKGEKFFTQNLQLNWIFLCQRHTKIPSRLL